MGSVPFFTNPGQLGGQGRLSDSGWGTGQQTVGAAHRRPGGGRFVSLEVWAQRCWINRGSCCYPWRESGVISATSPGCTMRVLKSNDFRLTSMLSDDLEGWDGRVWEGGDIRIHIS